MSDALEKLWTVLFVFCVASIVIGGMTLVVLAWLSSPELGGFATLLVGLAGLAFLGTR